MVSEVERAVERLTGEPATSSSPVGASVTEVRLAAGRRLVVKRYHQATEVLAEACSLRWLAAAGAVPVPEVVAHDESWLVTEHVEQGPATAAAAEELGRSLTRLHAAGAPAFGSPPVGGPAEATIGMASMLNVECASWPQFYAAHRIEPYLKTAIGRGSLRQADADAVERVIEQIEDLAGPEEPPSRLHGDLWSGNVLWSSKGRAWLIDPAAHGGHRETDLAMLHLFGCPHLGRIVDAYNEASPLSSGWRERIPLHQLFPLLVHAVLFGGSYGGQAGAAARSALKA